MTANKVAVFWDFENLHASLVNDRYGPDAYKGNVFRAQERLLDVPALMEYAVSLGDVVINRAYNNWQWFASYQFDLLKYAIDLIQIYPKRRNAKNGADIRLALDALEDSAANPHITHVVILGGDSDFVSLAQKLRKLGKVVIGVGMRSSTNLFWAHSCNEFKYYETLLSQSLPAPATETADFQEAPDAPLATRNEANDLEGAKNLLIRAIQRLMHEGDSDKVLKAKVRPMMVRLDSSFDPGNFGFDNFNAFLVACRDEIDTRKGDNDILVAIKGRSRSEADTVEAEPSSDLGNDESISAAPEAKSTARNPQDAVRLTAWALKTALFTGQKGVSLSEIGSTVRAIEPEFDPANYGYPKVGWLKKVLIEAEPLGIFVLEQEGGTKHEILCPTDRFVEYLLQTPAPEGLNQIRTRRMLQKLGFTAPAEDCARLMEAAARLFDTASSDALPVTTQQLRDLLCEVLAGEKPQNAKWTTLLSHLLRCEAFYGPNGEPAVEIGETLVARADPSEIALVKYHAMIDREVEAFFHEKPPFSDAGVLFA